MNKKNTLFNYIKKVTDWEIKVKTKEVTLPLYLRASYIFWYVTIADVELVFVYTKDNTHDLRLYTQVYKTLREKLDSQVVFVFDYLDARQINSLIQKHISFVVLDKYLYLPFVLMQIGTTEKSKNLAYKSERLTPDADLILMGYLDGRIYNGMMVKEIAAEIKREIRATSIALNLLDELEYASMQKVGRSKRVSFEIEFEVYERLLGEGISPQKKSFFTSSKIFGNKVVKSGYSALAGYSTLMDTGVVTVAISAKAKNLLSDLEICEEDEALYRVEVWDRDPHVFSQSNVINPLYVLRQFKDDEDERVEYALQEIEEKIKQNWNSR
jgi:hypothetical protein